MIPLNQPAADGIEARIAGLAARGPIVKLAVIPGRQEPEIPTARAAEAQPEPASPDHLASACRELIDRLNAEISSEQRAVLSRRDLAEIVGTAIDACLARHSVTATPLARRNLATSIMQALLAVPRSAPACAKSRKRQVEIAKAKIQPLILERIDVTAAADLPRSVFETQLTGWVKELLGEIRIQLNFAEERALVESLIADMLGHGPLEPLMGDEMISDILVNGPKQVYVERDGKLELTDVTFHDNAHLLNTCIKIVNRIGRRVEELSPQVDARLPDGSRINVIIPPLALDGPMLSIRKFGKKTLTLDSMAAGGSMSPAMARVLKIAARCRLNILISGGTGSGKTTLLNALSHLIDNTERTITIENTAELQLQQPHVGRLETRIASLDGTGEVTVRDLLKNALRMRPDRIIIGECRGEEALDMLQAMNTGHDGSMSTIHANSPRDALTRLEHMVGMADANLPSRVVRAQIAAAVHLICQVRRMRDGQRRITQISEIVGMEGETVTTQDLFRHKYLGDDGNGGLHGRFEASGSRPAFLSQAEYYGLDQLLLEAILGDAATSLEMAGVA